MATSIEEQGRYQDGNSIFENVFIQGTLNVATANEKLVVRSDGITIDTIATNSDGKTTFSGDVQINGDELFIADSIKHVGDTDTLISFPSNDTINFRTDGTERFRIADNGRVGINSTSPAATLDIRDIGSTGPGILISGCTETEGDLTVQEGEILHVGHFNSDTNTYTDRFRITTGGDVSITDGNLIMASGHGIDFSDTANGTGTTSSEIFNDYEEGSFTPSYNTSNSNIGTVTYDARSGRYIKVGRLCFITIRLRTDHISSVGSGFVRITGLPFTHVNVANNRAVTHNIWTNNWTSTDAPSLALIQNNTTHMRLYQKAHNEDISPSSGLPVSAFNTGTTAGNGGNDNDVRLTAIYETST